MKFLSLYLPLFFLGISAQASDYNPPQWRGQSNASYQLWRFDFTESDDTGVDACETFNSNTTPWGQRSTPDVIENPFQISTGICSEYQTPWMISGRMDWLRDYDLRKGVWMLASDRRLPVFMNFMVANADNNSGKTEVHVQIVYQLDDADPSVILRYPASTPDQGFHEVNASGNESHTDLPINWKLKIFRFELDQCPLYQIIQIQPPDNKNQMHIDEVVIDSICKIPS